MTKVYFNGSQYEEVVVTAVDDVGFAYDDTDDILDSVDINHYVHAGITGIIAHEVTKEGKHNIRIITNDALEMIECYGKTQ